MEKINVMQVMPEFGLAGAETMCEALCYELLKTGKVNLTVVSLYNFHSPITDRMEKKGINVVYLNKKHGVDLSLTGKLVKLMKQYKIHVVHTHRYVMQYAIPAAILAGVPARVHTVHSVATKELGSSRRKLAKIFYKHNRVAPVAISPKIRETVMQEYGMTEDQIAVAYNGSDLSKCITKDSYLPNGSFRFIHIGRLTPLKNQEMILHAVKRLKDRGLDICADFLGGGEKEQDYKTLTQELGLCEVVTFHGLQADVHPFLNRADAFLLPSSYEGMPVTLIEAMGTGLPAIAARVGGIPDMIEDQVSGLLIEPELEELVAAMERIVADEELRSRLGQKARVCADAFSAQNMCKGYMEVYHSCLKQSK